VKRYKIIEKSIVFEDLSHHTIRYEVMYSQEKVTDAPEEKTFDLSIRMDENDPIIAPSFTNNFGRAEAFCQYCADYDLTPANLFDVIEDYFGSE